MYGTREFLCQTLAANHPETEPLALLVWTEVGIKELTARWGAAATDDEVQAVLEKIGQVSGEDYQLDGISADVVAEMLSEVKHENSLVMMPTDLLARLITTAEQALWPEEWRARDEGEKLSAGLTRKLTDVARARDLLSR